MKHLLLASLLLVPQDDPRKPPAIRTKNIPAVPLDLVERLAQYQNVRSAGFQDFTPDGNLLVATRFGNTAQLHVVHGPGGRREQITFFEEPVSDAVFVPATGTLLLSMGRGGDENYQIYRLDRSTGKAVLLTDGTSRNSMGVFQKNGRKLTFNSNRRNGRDTDLFLLDPETGETSVLLETEKESWFVADWSPDDSKALLLRYVSVNESYPYVLDVATKKRTAIPIPGGKVAAHDALKFAPDGKSVYLSTDAEGEFKHLAKVDLSTMRYEWVTKDIPWDVTDLEVHGERVVFVVNEDGMSRMYLLEGGKRRGVDLPMGTLGGLRFSKDGRRIGFTLNRPEAPGDAYVHDFEKLTRWTYSEVGGLDASKFVTPERIRFRSFDGLEIPAYVFKPSGRRGKAPVIISIHGGPEGQSRPTFGSLTQFYVQELGCAAILPNVRGSTGYGKTFVALDNGVKREDSVRDIGALLDWIAKQPDLDADRVAVIGGSYGGYMVLGSLVNFPDRIRAGVDIVGISNFITFLEKTSAYRQDLRRVEYGDERNPEVRAVLEKISPVNRVDRIRAKLLVIHGKNDPRVPVGEAEQIAAKVEGSWLMIADNEGHGFARKENRDYSNVVIALFFQKHLIGE